MHEDYNEHSLLSAIPSHARGSSRPILVELQRAKGMEAAPLCADEHPQQRRFEATQSWPLQKRKLKGITAVGLTGNQPLDEIKTSGCSLLLVINTASAADIKGKRRNEHHPYQHHTIQFDNPINMIRMLWYAHHLSTLYTSLKSSRLKNSKEGHKAWVAAHSGR